MTVVVAYIPTPQGRSALARGIVEAELRTARLVVVNSSRGDSIADPNFSQESDLATVREQLDAAGLQHEIRQHVRGKDAADEVVEAAAETDAELVVIGLRRRSQVGKLIMGSTAQRILLNSAAPVLAVKSDER